MPKAKIAITLPIEQLKHIRNEVRAGRASSISSYISNTLAQRVESVQPEKRESLRALLDDLVKLHGEPSAEDYEWADRMLNPQ